MTYDWIIIGGGITGFPLAYELVKAGLKVLLLEKTPLTPNATYCSYGGLAYWSGTTPITAKLCEEGITLHRQLSQELEAKTGYREIGLLLTLFADSNQEQLRDHYQQFSIQPQWFDRQETLQREPILNQGIVESSFYFPHGQVNPIAILSAYQNAFLRLGGVLHYEPVIHLEYQSVTTLQNHYHSNHIAVCAGGWSRDLLKTIYPKLPLYFSHEQSIQTQPSSLKMTHQVMPANLQRIVVEQKVTHPLKDELWQKNCEIYPPVIDAGGVQFQDGHFCLGQTSYFHSNAYYQFNPVFSENQMRESLRKLSPDLATIPGQWHHCITAFTHNSLPFIGEVIKGVFVFSGFTATFLLAPPLARHFVQWIAGNDDIIPQLAFSYEKTD